MKKIIITLVIVVAISVVAGLNFHFILMDNNIKLLRKADLTLEYTFVDARGMNRAKLYINPTLIRAGVKDIFEDQSVTIGK